MTHPGPRIDGLTGGRAVDPARRQGTGVESDRGGEVSITAGSHWSDRQFRIAVFAIVLWFTTIVGAGILVFLTRGGCA